MNQEDWGSLLRTRRKALGITQYQAALMAGCSHYVIVQMEKGRTTTQVDNFLAVLDVLGLTLEITEAK